MIDFSFMSKMLRGNYSSMIGRTAEDVEKCKHCPFKNSCYKEGAKSKTYNVKIKDDTHIKQMDYMETDGLKTLYKKRYKIEAKNG